MQRCSPTGRVAALLGAVTLGLVAGRPATGATTLASHSSDPERAIAEARERWRKSPHGPMLERTLPPSLAVTQLPERDSNGAQLLVRYCVQCHHLPNPAMHEAAKWPKVVERMVTRIEGKGNYGALMRSMMGGVFAPNPSDQRVLLAYLSRHAQTPIDPTRYAVALATPRGRSFRQACQQCHALPDPARHTAAEWPRVVARMTTNMAWMNRVVGAQPDPREPQLRIEDINAFLAAYARR